MARGFPHIAHAGGDGGADRPRRSLESVDRLGALDGVSGPRILGLAELERRRDALVVRVSEAERATAQRVRDERRARARLAAMKLEPGRYKFARLRVADLGEGGCGMWEVRPTLGLVGMLAGWWRVKLSSGCP